MTSHLIENDESTVKMCMNDLNFFPHTKTYFFEIILNV